MTTMEQNNKVSSIKEIPDLLQGILRALFNSSVSENKIERIQIDIPDLNIINWFENQNSEEKLFWSDRDNKFTVAGIHFAEKLQNGDDQTHPLLFKQLQSRLENSDGSVRYFGGLKFDTASQMTDSWNQFGTAAFFLPRFELLKRNNSYQFVCNINFPDDNENLDSIISQLLELDFSLNASTPYNNEITNRSDYPEQDEWNVRVLNALDAMNDNKYEKIVLARKTELTFKENLHPDRVMSTIFENTSNCFHFCFQLNSSNAFVGATPERLYYRKNDILKCEAVAGTRSRGDDEKQDRSLGDELLRSQKDIREHKYVIDSILEALKNYTKENDSSPSDNVLLIQLAKVQHLMKRFTFTVQNEISDFDLVNSLHPTAAVGGYPKKNIFKEISDLEKFDRGWYAAPVGWVSKETSEFAVAIRSGLINKNKMILYSGAGIIDGSIPESEWDEIENKISNFLKILDS